MHYYRFNIGDYKSHTSHLGPIEDIAYRRMLDWQYLHERELPLDIPSIAKAIGMRSHSECIEYVLSEFYEETEKGYINKRVWREIATFNEKSEKAAKSARARWGKHKDANALQTQSEGNANHKPITNNQEIKEKNKQKRKSFVPPDVSMVAAYCKERKNGIDPHQFVNHYDANGWMRGKTKIKDWKACVRTWEKNHTLDSSKSNGEQWT